MSAIQAAIYARVSSDVQQEARTIESQLADLRTCIARRGLQLAPELEFVDDGYSGATLVRPALERLRDVAAAGALTSCMCIVPIGWHATTPIRCCCWRSCSGLGSK